MKARDNLVLRIGAWRVDPALDQISMDRNSVKLEPRAMQLLVCLAEHAGQVVSVEQLLDEVWTGVVVTPDSVYHAVAALRRTLGDDPNEPTYIANVPRRGYRLVAPAAPWVEAPNAPGQNSAAAAVESVTGTRPAPTSPFRRYALVISVGLALALGYFAADRIWLSKRAMTTEHQTMATAAIVGDRSIAVLPFVDLSEKKDQEYFADGMAEEILDLLATIPALKVIGRTSSFQFKGKNEDLRAIGVKLGVAYLLEGSVRKSGNRVRVTAQLLDSQDGTHRWSGTYDRDVGDVLKMQEEIAAGIVRALQIAVGADDLPARAALGNSEAYNLYLRGRYALTHFDKKGLDEAPRDFQQALDLDPTSAITAAWLAFSFQVQGEWGYVATSVASEQARRAAESALQRDPTLELPHLVLGAIHQSYDYDWAAADKEFQQALALAPYDASATAFAAQLSMCVGRWDEALTQLNASLAQEPLDAGSYEVLDWIQARRGRLTEAEAAARRVLDISPTYDGAHYFLGLILIARGERKAALAEMEKETLTGGQLAGLAMARYALGRTAASDAALARMVKEQANDLPFMIAEAHAFRGEPDQAFKWLDRAYNQKDPMLYFIKGELPLKNLESDPRYKSFLRKMNLPE